jgi:transposase
LIPVSSGTIVTMVIEGAALLDGFLAELRDQLGAADVAHADETGLRVEASLHWVHSVSTRLLTLYHLDEKRGTRRWTPWEYWPTSPACWSTTGGPPIAGTPH